VLPLGPYYKDDERLITTAAAVRALGIVLGRSGHTPRAERISVYA
jgi:hypothetical protein